MRRRKWARANGTENCDEQTTRCKDTVCGPTKKHLKFKKKTNNNSSFALLRSYRIWRCEISPPTMQLRLFRTPVLQTQTPSWNEKLRARKNKSSCRSDWPPFVKALRRYSCEHLQALAGGRVGGRPGARADGRADGRSSGRAARRNLGSRTGYVN